MLFGWQWTLSWGSPTAYRPPRDFPRHADKAATGSSLSFYAPYSCPTLGSSVWKREKSLSTLYTRDILVHSVYVHIFRFIRTKTEIGSWRWSACHSCPCCNGRVWNFASQPQPSVFLLKGSYFVRTHTVLFSEVTLDKIGHQIWVCGGIGEGLDHNWSEYEQIPASPFWEKLKKPLFYYKKCSRLSPQ